MISRRLELLLRTRPSQSRAQYTNSTSQDGDVASLVRTASNSGPSAAVSPVTSSAAAAPCRLSSPNAGAPAPFWARVISPRQAHGLGRIPSPGPEPRNLVYHVAGHIGIGRE